MSENAKCCVTNRHIASCNFCIYVCCVQISLTVQQEQLGKASTSKLRQVLLSAGASEEKVESMDRPALKEAVAQQKIAAMQCDVASEIELKKMEFEIKRMEMEMEERRQERDKNVQKSYSSSNASMDGPASVAQLAETQCAPTGTVCQRSRGSIPQVGW